MMRFLQSKDVRESPTRYWSGGPPSVTNVQHFRNAKLPDVVLRAPEVLECYGAVLTVLVLSTSSTSTRAPHSQYSLTSLLRATAQQDGDENRVVLRVLRC